MKHAATVLRWLSVIDKNDDDTARVELLRAAAAVAEAQSAATPAVAFESGDEHLVSAAVNMALSLASEPEVVPGGSTKGGSGDSAVAPLGVLEHPGASSEGGSGGSAGCVSDPVPPESLFDLLPQSVQATVAAVTKLVSSRTPCTVVKALVEADGNAVCLH